MRLAEPPGEKSAATDTRTALARLPHRDRARLLDRVMELRSLDRLMRERGTLPEVAS